MKTKVALMCLGLVSAGFCVDEYLPIAPSTLEVDVGVNPVFPEVGDMSFGIPLQIKYGIMPGLDVEVATNYTASGAATGLVQPDIAAKYSIGSTGFAAYLDVVLPFSTGDFDVAGAGLGIAPGIVYGKNFDKIQAVAKASYLLNMEKDGLTNGNVLDVFLKPGYMVDDKLAGYVGVDFKMTGKPDPAGPGAVDGNTITLLPGATYTVSPSIALEANVPIVLSNDLGGTSWGVWASVYYTMPL
jgi:hypothetical protein